MENIDTFKKQKMGWLINQQLFACPLFEHLNSLSKFWTDAPKDLSIVIDLIKELRSIEEGRKNDHIKQYDDDEHIPWHGFYHDESFYSLENNLTLYVYQQGLIRLGIYNKKLYVDGFSYSIKKNLKTLKLIANFLKLDLAETKAINHPIIGNHIIDDNICQNHFPDFYEIFKNKQLKNSKNKNIILYYDIMLDSKNLIELQKDLSKDINIKLSSNFRPNNFYEVQEKNNLPEFLLNEVYSKYFIQFPSNLQINKIKKDYNI